MKSLKRFPNRLLRGENRVKRKVIFVTSFLDIGRANWSVSPRSSEEYFSAFEQWSKIRNTTYVFAFKEMAEKVRALNRPHLKVREVPDNFLWESEYTGEAYLRMRRIERDPFFIDFRSVNYPSDAPENKAVYNLVCALKMHWIERAALEEGNKEAYFAWIDFGFNHPKSRQYPYIEDFDRSEWFFDPVDQDSEMDVFLFRKLGVQIPPTIYHMIYSAGESFIGGFFMVKGSAVPSFTREWNDALERILDMELMDDDQALIGAIVRKVYTARNKPNLDIAVLESDWCLGLKQMGCKLRSLENRPEFFAFVPGKEN